MGNVASVRLKVDRRLRLLEKIVYRLDKFEDCLGCFDNLNNYEEKMYRFYHQSFKVYGLQQITERGVELLKQCDPKKKKSFCTEYKEILKEGTGKKFEMSHNQMWTQETRPILEAFLHTKYFLEMGLKYGLELKLGSSPNVIPFGWAALLELYNIR